MAPLNFFGFVVFEKGATFPKLESSDHNAGPYVWHAHGGSFFLLPLCMSCAETKFKER